MMMTEHATNKNTQHKRVMMDESSPSPLIFHFDYYWTQHNNSKLRSLYIDALGVLFIILFFWRLFVKLFVYVTIQHI
jgi:hypothetical protein